MNALGRVLLAVSLSLMGVAAAPASAQQVSREQDIVALRLGQRVLVDDGTCPAGQIKEISGARLTGNGVAREAKCIPRAVRK